MIEKEPIDKLEDTLIEIQEITNLLSILKVEYFENLGKFSYSGNDISNIEMYSYLDYLRLKNQFETLLTVSIDKLLDITKNTL